MCLFHLPVRGLSHHVNLAQLALELLQKPTKITAREASKSRQLKGGQANQLRGQINQRNREPGLYAGNGLFGGQSSWHLSVLCSWRCERAEFLPSRRSTDHGTWKQTVLVPALPLRSAGGLESIGEYPPFVLPRISLAPTSQKERMTAGLVRQQLGWDGSGFRDTPLMTDHAGLSATSIPYFYTVWAIAFSYIFGYSGIRSNLSQVR
jgi:hypothetical protein